MVDTQNFTNGGEIESNFERIGGEPTGDIPEFWQNLVHHSLRSGQRVALFHNNTVLAAWNLGKCTLHFAYQPDQISHGLFSIEIPDLPVQPEIHEKHTEEDMYNFIRSEAAAIILDNYPLIASYSKNRRFLSELARSAVGIACARYISNCIDYRDAQSSDLQVMQIIQSSVKPEFDTRKEISSTHIKIADSMAEQERAILLIKQLSGHEKGLDLEFKFKGEIHQMEVPYLCDSLSRYKQIEIDPNDYEANQYFFHSLCEFFSLEINNQDTRFYRKLEIINSGIKDDLIIHELIHVHLPEIIRLAELRYLRGYNS